MEINSFEELVIKTKNGDKEAEKELYEKFRPFIINLCKKSFIDGYTFEDIYQECYLALSKAVKYYNVDKHRFFGYALTAIKNQVNYKIRRSVPEKESNCYVDNFEFVEQTTHDLVEDIILKADYDVLLKSLKNLDEKEQHLIRQCFFKNKSYRQYANEVHLTYSQVMFIKRKALTKLQKQLLDNK